MSYHDSYLHYTHVTKDVINMPGLGGIGKLLSKAIKTSKAETKAATAKAPRQKRQSDEAYNARRRFKRQAERFAKEASKFTGTSTGARFDVLAREMFDLAKRTYKNKQGEYDTELIKCSKSALMGSGMTEDRETDIIMRSHVGSRIYAATIDIWKDEDYDNREDAILKRFKAKSMSEVLRKLEQDLGSSLYSDDTKEKYDLVVSTIMDMIE